VKYAQFRVIGDHSVAGYTALVFLASFVAGLTALLLKPGDLRNLAGGKVLFWGLMLGMANFGSVYFFIKALNHAPQTGILSGSSVVFTANNTGIVILSVLAGLYFFRERLSILNKIGILFSLASIALFYAV